MHPTILAFVAAIEAALPPEAATLWPIGSLDYTAANDGPQRVLSGPIVTSTDPGTIYARHLIQTPQHSSRHTENSP